MVSEHANTVVRLHVLSWVAGDSWCIETLGSCHFVAHAASIEPLSCQASAAVGAHKVTKAS